MIDEIDGVPPEAPTKVIQQEFELASRGWLSADGLAELAERLAVSNEPAEIIQLEICNAPRILRRVTRAGDNLSAIRMRQRWISWAT